VKEIIEVVMPADTSITAWQLAVLDNEEKVISAFSNDPDELVDGVLTSFDAAGVLWRSAHGNIQGFTAMTQAVKNNRYGEPYAGTIKQTNRTPGV
jgi:hypothetical protein